MYMNLYGDFPGISCSLEVLGNSQWCIWIVYILHEEKAMELVAY